MRTEQCLRAADGSWTPAPPGALGTAASVVFAFGGTSALKRPGALDAIRVVYPNAAIMGCTTAGEICGDHVNDDSIVVTAVALEHSRVHVAWTSVGDAADSIAAGHRLADALPVDGLVHAFVLSDGLKINGSDLVKGLSSRLPTGVSVTGGLSGDGSRFQETLVYADGEFRKNVVAVAGFYGERLRVGYGSLGGWDPFGPERRVTRSMRNVLFELDNQSALQLYKKYLGEHATGLPATALLFPLSVRVHDAGEPVVRTILGVSEPDQTMTFAGDVPEGSFARFMKANFDRLVDGAVGAARTSFEALGSRPPDLALLISCVGRKLILGQRIEEEVEGVRDVLGAKATMTGFYSYGEISPFTPSARCELHNQTMTITTFTEV
jgi:hypothetical protein